MTFAMADVLGTIEVASLAVIGYVLTRPVRFSDAHLDAARIAAATTVIITGTLHLALRLHLIV